MATIGTGWVDGAWIQAGWITGAWDQAASITVTGTVITEGITEAGVVAGGKTIILTLVGDTWVGAGPFLVQRGNILAGISAATSPALGWNSEWRDNELPTAVVRTSDTVVTVTMSAQAAYDISATETITITIPASALTTSASAVVASPTFDVTAVVLRKGGGYRRRVSRYPRRVLIEGVIHWAASAEQERALLAAYVQEVEREALAMALEGAPPEQMRTARVKVRKAANRLQSVDNREQAWIQRLIEEDDELILAVTIH